ncbi:MAG: SGNH/GDSL hydrolase family protein [Lachnospiraceae bacterium]|nr:SGNH/GDSL hydrolase family protein [Lachnospiraceae bacterium]
MKKIRTIIFVALLIGILFGISGVINHVYLKKSNMVTGREENLAGLQKEEDNTIDLLVLGDSESYTSISTMMLWKEDGISSYIGAQSGQQIQETYYMLKQALQTQKPKLVMLETHVLFRDNAGMDAYRSVMEENAMYHFSVFRYHNIWKRLLSSNIGDDRQFFKGFRVRDSVAPYDGGDYMQETTVKKQMTGFVKNYLQQIIDICKENDIPILFYSAPSPVNYNYQKHNTLIEYTENAGIPYVDLNMMTSELGIDWTKDTLDHGDHLNIYGAQKVTKYMRKYLEENYNLPDHRGQQKYKDWDVLEDQYEKRLLTLKV